MQALEVMVAVTDNRSYNIDLPPSDVQLQQKLMQLSGYFVAVPIIVGILTLTGWQFDIGFFTHPLSRLTGMNPVTALAFICSGASYYLLSSRSKGRLMRIAGLLLAGVVMSIGALRLLDIIFHTNINIDLILFYSKLGLDDKGNIVSRISPFTAFNFILICIALLLMGRSLQKGTAPGHIISFIVSFVGIFAVLAYVYKVQNFYGLFTYVPMAMLSAICFLCLSGALLFANPGKGIMKVFTTPYAGSIMARRLVPVAILIPAIIGSLRLVGHWAKLFATEFWVALLVLSIMVIFLLFIWYTANLLNKRDRLKREAEEKMRRFNQDLEQLVQERTLKIARNQQEILQMNEELHRLSAHLQDVREEERVHIAREIHDELGQQLTAIKMDIATINKRLNIADKEINSRMEGVLEMMDTAVQSVRRIASELRPGVLDDLGLMTALEWHSREFEKRTGIKVLCAWNLPDLEMCNSCKVAVFRIFQESLTNISRHSGATAVDVQMTVTDSQLQLKITDNGTGFDMQSISKKRTLGLMGIKERAVMLGGEYEIISNPGIGTTVLVSVPLEEKA